MQIKRAFKAIPLSDYVLLGGATLATTGVRVWLSGWNTSDVIAGTVGGFVVGVVFLVTVKSFRS